MYSYTNILKKYLKSISPKHVIEWGPGKSTSIILSHLSDNSTLTSIEHDSKYYKKIIDEIDDKRWNGLQSRCTGRVAPYAHIIFKQSPADLYFIDGRRRVECAFAAMSHSPNSYIILHDASRQEYTDILLSFIDLIEYKDDTMVFRLKTETILE